MAENTPKDYEKFLQPTTFVDKSGNLKTLQYNPLSGSSAWNIDSFKTGYDTFLALQTADVEQYGQIMLGDKEALKQLEAEKVEASRQGVIGVAQNGMLGFGRVQAEPLAELVWGSDGRALLSYAISSPLYENTSNEKHVVAVGEVRKAKSDLEAIAADKNSFLNGKFSGLPAVSVAFHAPFASELIQDYQNSANNRAVTAIGEFGAPKFVAENINVAGNLHDKYVAEMTRLNTEMKAEADAARDSEGKITEDKANEINTKYKGLRENIAKEVILGAVDFEAMIFGNEQRKIKSLLEIARQSVPKPAEPSEAA